MQVSRYLTSKVLGVITVLGLFAIPALASDDVAVDPQSWKYLRIIGDQFEDLSQFTGITIDQTLSRMGSDSLEELLLSILNDAFKQQGINGFDVQITDGTEHSDQITEFNGIVVGNGINLEFSVKVVAIPTLKAKSASIPGVLIVFEPYQRISILDSNGADTGIAFEPFAYQHFASTGNTRTQNRNIGIIGLLKCKCIKSQQQRYSSSDNMVSDCTDDEHCRNADVCSDGDCGWEKGATFHPRG